MRVTKGGEPQVHDLLEIEPDSLCDGCLARPPWVDIVLSECPYVVVRRIKSDAGQVAIGVRGRTRGERWPALCSTDSVRRVIRPEDLLALTHSENEQFRTPALRALLEMQERWAGIPWSWGPGGSVGFEMATGRPVTTDSSDLDLILRAPKRLGRDEARTLWALALGIEAKLDVRVETGECGFSLEEYARSGSKQILLRCQDGVRTGADPWAVALAAIKPQEARP